MASGHCRDGRPGRPHASVAPVRGTCMRVGGSRECRGWPAVFPRSCSRRRGRRRFTARQPGLDPASAKRINPHRRPGRPLGAVSSPDRAALPPRQMAGPPAPCSRSTAGADDAEGPHGRRQPGHGARRWRSSAPRLMRASRSVSPRGGIESTSWTSNRAGTGRRSVRVGRRNMRPVRSRRLWMRRLFPSSTGACMFAHESSPPSCAWWPPAGSSASASLSRRSWEANPFRHGSSGSWRPS
jgi:hypothetical protein